MYLAQVKDFDLAPNNLPILVFNKAKDFCAAARRTNFLYGNVKMALAETEDECLALLQTEMNKVIGCMGFNIADFYMDVSMSQVVDGLIWTPGRSTERYNIGTLERM